MNKSPSLRFKDSLGEAFRLLDIHEELTGIGPGRRRNVEVLNKSAILFVCAAFEAFVETLAEEAFQHLVVDSKDSAALPKAIRQAIADVVRSDKNELKVWDLAGDGWRSVSQQYRVAVLAKYTGPFNTPKPHNIEALFRELVGLKSLPAEWKWKGMTSEKASLKLKDFVTLRGALAHGEIPAPTVNKAQALSYLKFLAAISVRSSNVVRKYCHQTTGKYPWAPVHYNSIE